MRIALLADIHGNLPALLAVVADLRRHAIDQIVTLGDHLSGPLLPRETADYLMAQPWRHIAGNHERQLLAFDAITSGASDRHAHACLTEAHLDWLRSLPATASLEGVLCCHGSPTEDTQCLLETVAAGRLRLATADEIQQRLGVASAGAIACGHSHVPRAVRTASQLVVNPGRVGLPAFDDTSPTYHVVETGSPDARYAVLTRSLGGWAVDLVSVSYDFAAMAELAERNGRPEWAQALRTGYVLNKSGNPA